MKRCLLFVVGISVFSVLLSAEERTHLRANLKALEENPTNVTDGTGTFRAVVINDNTIRFRLTYRNLSTPVVQSHIHIGATKTNGAIAIFFCGPAGSAAHQTCPNDSTNSGSVTGTVGPADVVIDAQGVSPGEFAKVLRAIVNGDTYVNVHTTRLPGGEIRGQVKSEEDEDDE
jgi:CHRD domain-containing protein